MTKLPVAEYVSPSWPMPFLHVMASSAISLVGLVLLTEPRLLLTEACQLAELLTEPRLTQELILVMMVPVLESVPLSR